MWHGKRYLTAWAVACLAPAAVAELQEVKVGGQIIVLGEYYRNIDPGDNDLRIPASRLRGRPIGLGLGEDIISAFAFDKDGGHYAYVSQWTRLNVEAAFTGGVGLTVEFDQISEWGSEFRSNYVTGADVSGSGSVDLYQAYVEASDLFGQPLRLRLGRQELRFGSEWLVGGNDVGTVPVWGLSFDGIRFTYGRDTVTLDLWGAKLFDDGGAEADGDVDFYGVYGSYTGVDAMALDAYWLFLRDGGRINDSRLGFASEWLERVWGVDDYAGTRLHTIGLRASGAVGALDFEAEVAYQFGRAGHAGSLFRPAFYGDDGANYGNFGVNLEVGYTFDVPWEPRLFLAYAWLEGEDKRDIGALDRLASLVNPYYTRDASISFNRLFSNWYYSNVLDGTDMSNAHIFRTGLGVAPTEKIEIGLDLGYYLADATFDHPRWPLLPFWTRAADRELGFEFDLYITYAYSEDLYFMVGWDRLYVGDGLRRGHFNASNGLEFVGGSAGNNVDYFYFETGITF